MGVRFRSAVFLFPSLASILFTGCNGTGPGPIQNQTQNQSQNSSYTVGGTVSGLSGSGLVLQVNGGNNLAVSANGAFTFSTSLAAGSSFLVAVLTQPSNPSQSCAVTNGVGSVTTSNVASIQVTCTVSSPPPSNYTIGGTVSGLTSSGLVLQDNGSDNLTVNTNGAFTFATPLAAGSSYLVTVLTQPSNPAQSCAVSNSFGYVATSKVTTVQVTCTVPNSGPDAQAYSIGGTVSGLTGSGLVLQDNGSDNLAVSTDGGFTFANPLAAGSHFFVTVLTQPSEPAQSCIASSASGSVIFSDATDVEVTCTTLPASPPPIVTAAGEWTWASGANVPGQAGVYGQLGVPAVGNTPGARGGAAGWTDSQGNFWLFGGEGPSVGGGCAVTHALCWGAASQYLNDLWKFDGSEWTWMGGSSSPNQTGVYGTMGEPNRGNVPGARVGALSWSDKQGNFWLYGGEGTGSSGYVGVFTDLWKYSGGQWTWMGGSQLINQAGVYGTRGTPSPDNHPGARYGAVAFADPSGNVWLFGGQGYDSEGEYGCLNDVWELSGGEWMWVSGSSTSYPAQPGVYGTMGTPSPNNIPGARYNSTGWMDASGNLWIFGGVGYDLLDFNVGGLNDFMRLSSGEWTWMGGSDNLFDETGTYGTEGTPAPGNIPGSRDSAASWTDAKGNLWLFSGEDMIGGEFNDLWEYSAGEWTWVGGYNTGAQTGAYGILGVPAPGNIPGPRSGTVTWTDAKGNLWLFGGSGMNDLWVYQPQ